MGICLGVFAFRRILEFRIEHRGVCGFRCWSHSQFEDNLLNSATPKNPQPLSPKTLIIRARRTPKKPRDARNPDTHTHTHKTLNWVLVQGFNLRYHFGDL